MAKDGRSRFVIGSVGPGTRLPSLGHIAYQPLEDALTVQCRGLIAGGVDAILIETCQDPLQIKAAVNGAKRARAEAGKDTPIFVQVTVETTGTLLVGADIAAAATVIKALDVAADRPQLRHRPAGDGGACEVARRELAGPHLDPAQCRVARAGRRRDALSAAPRPSWRSGWSASSARTASTSSAAAAAPTCRISARSTRCCGGWQATASARAPVSAAACWVPSVASLYGQIALRQENAYLSIGERCNANGSKQFRAVAGGGRLGRLRRDGARAGRRKARTRSISAPPSSAATRSREMNEVVTRLRGAVNAPLVIDSTETAGARGGAQALWRQADHQLDQFRGRRRPGDKAHGAGASRFGTAVIALTIDEQGMAKEVERKVEVARRLHDFACNRHGLPPSDLLFDPLTFTICTGNEDDRQARPLRRWKRSSASPRNCRSARSSSASPTSPSASTRRRATC